MYQLTRNHPKPLNSFKRISKTYEKHISNNKRHAKQAEWLLTRSHPQVSHKYPTTNKNPSKPFTTHPKVSQSYQKTNKKPSKRIPNVANT